MSIYTRKSSSHAFEYTGKWEVWEKFQQKIFNSMVVGDHQRLSIFQTKYLVFMKIMEICVTFSVGF